MEDGVVTISRAAGTVTYPANFSLIAAANPCPCGYFGSDTKSCKCLPGQISRYQKRISGPILDRIDIHVTIPQVKVEKLIAENTDSETSESIQKRVQESRERQLERFKDLNIKSNSEMNTKQVKEFCSLAQDAEGIMRHAVRVMNLSARSYYRVLKVARTIADLTGEENMNAVHVSEALQYRPRDDDF
jgi:magnesium chelatase family protein